MRISGWSSDVCYSDLVKLVFRDWPVFGAASTEAARAAIASKWQGKHSAFNDALMTTTGTITSKTIRAAADKAGGDWAKQHVDLTAHKTEIGDVLDRHSSYRTGRASQRETACQYR